MTAGSTDDSTWDPVGTSHLFDQLAYSASKLAWNFDEQIDGTPRGLLREWRLQLMETQAYLAEIKEEFERSDFSARGSEDR